MVCCAIAVPRDPGEAPAAVATAETSPSVPFPLDNVLIYAVTWMKMRCGTMTLHSYGPVDDGADGSTYRIVLTASSGRFFDRVYRVRARLESWYDAELMSSVRYRDISLEKNEHKREVYDLDLASGTVMRTKDDETRTFTIEPGSVHDPLAYVYRLRALAEEPGERITLRLVTSKTALDTAAWVAERREIRTPFGRREVFKVHPGLDNDMLFSKQGKVVLWIGTDPARTPYKISFDLAFGKLVARLIAIDTPAEHEPLFDPSELEE